MKLLTDEIAKDLPRLYEMQQVKDPLCLVKYFLGYATWYVIEYDPKEKIFFGFVVIQEAELGYFFLNELEEVKSMGLKVERDLYFKPTPLSEVKKLYGIIDE